VNAAAQRTLTPWLAGGVVLLGAALLALLAGAGRGVHWDPPRPPAPLPAIHPVALPPTPPLGGYAVVWQRPLFSSDRRPAASGPAGGARVSLGDLELTGIILTPGLRMALLHDKSAGDKDGAEVRVREGDALPDGGWKLVELKPRTATFASAGRRTELKLPAGAPIDALPPPAPTPPEGASAPGAGLRPGGMGQPHARPAPPAGHAGAAKAPAPESPLQRMLRLRQAILKQRARQDRANDGDH